MNVGLEYPSGFEMAWIAADSSGKLGAFITAGKGPIPKEILQNIFVEPVLIEDVLLELPVIGLSDVNGSPYSHPVESFVELGERGIFVFDWHDLHVPIKFRKGGYEKCASPSNPIYTGELVSPLKELSNLIQFKELLFEEVYLVKPELYYDCLFPEF